jgi:hypothetical protein
MKKMGGELFAALKNHQFIMTGQWKKRTSSGSVFRSKKPR